LSLISLAHAHASKVIGRCGGDEKPNDHAEPTKVEVYKKKIKLKN